ncbi:hypothetical protein AAG906_032503 [Vitis piasezkii]
MCPNRDWVSTYEIVSKGVVVMGNNASCKIAGIGMVRIKMNLISLSTLDSKWYKYTSECGVLKMTKLSRRGLLNGRSQIHKRHSQHKGTLDYIHYDLWGSSRVPSKGGASYMFTIIDDFFIKVWVFFLKQKSDVLATFKEGRL